jgi:hypothetical protein
MAILKAKQVVLTVRIKKQALANYTIVQRMTTELFRYNALNFSYFHGVGMI